MAALTVDLLNQVVWLLRAANFKGGTKAKAPKPMWRPTDKPKPKVDGNVELARYRQALADAERTTGAPKGVAPAGPDDDRKDGDEWRLSLLPVT